ncbi:MAG: carbohydrate-binding protein [Polyangiaceae bacterium]
MRSKRGSLIVALTDEADQGILPDPPGTPPTDDRFIVEAEDFDAYSDTTPGNSGNAQCSSTDVDAELTLDPAGGRCNVGWTTAGEWLDYSIEIPVEGTYDVVLRLASQSSHGRLHLEVDGADVSGPISGPGEGWQSFSDHAVGGIPLSPGLHWFRLFFDIGEVNVNFFEIKASNGPLCEPRDCDDDDPCTSDTCSDGTCTHRPNGTCPEDGPCSGLCTNAISFTSSSYYSGELGTGARCYQTTETLNGGHCGNLAEGRSFSLNSVVMPSGTNFPTPLPQKRNGGYCFQISQGDYPWAFFVTW